ncbi:hypothetical protein ACWOFR_02965 [Carnobacterium gallinarum]|uniref:hypothetical protein n=1 Tax=Carnobacterium gallinarum TaxID=2749 RepID=UPI00054F9297|nr:hypothetical protein [Carnobacterium gallinarum]
MSLYAYIGTEKELTVATPQNEAIVAMIARDTLDKGVTDDMVLSYLQAQLDDETITLDQIAFYDTEKEIVGGFELLNLAESSLIKKHFTTNYVYECSDFPVWEPIENDTESASEYSVQQVEQYEQMMDEARMVNQVQQEGLMAILETCFATTDKVELYACWAGDEEEREANRRIEKWAIVQTNPLLLDLAEKEFLVIEK